MKLHTNAREVTKGLLFKKTAYEMDSRIELSDEEQEMLKRHLEVGKLPVAKGVFGGDTEIECTVNMLVKGMTDSDFRTLAHQTQFERSLQDGCTRLRAHLDRLCEVGDAKSKEF